MSCFIFDLCLYAPLSSNGRLFKKSAFEFRILLFAVQLVLVKKAQSLKLPLFWGREMPVSQF